MKLRFTPNSVRLRLNQVEVAKFAVEGTLLERVDFPGPAQSALVYSLRIGSDAEGGYAQFVNGEFAVIVPRGQAEAWSNDGKEVGLYYNLELAGGKSLRISVEKDYQCVDGPPEEHDSAGYPNPLARVGCKTEKR